MKQIRNNVFETNSSSTHSICISKKPVTIGKSVYFGIGEFGWENDCADTADYLYTAILEQNNRDVLLDKLKGILEQYSIEYTFERPRFHISDDGKRKWLDYGYIDHGYELKEFIDTLLSNEDLLMRYLFGDSCVYTGNDNQDNIPDGCNIADEYYYAEDENGNYGQMVNPYHDPENYDYFYKGN